MMIDPSLSPATLTLGTAALGMPYGIANPQTKPSNSAAFGLLDAAWAAGIGSFDTAPAYGDAETLIGRWCRRTGATPTVVTKLPKTAANTNSVTDDVACAIDTSLQCLGTSRLDAT